MGRLRSRVGAGDTLLLRVGTRRGRDEVESEEVVAEEEEDGWGATLGLLGRLLDGIGGGGMFLISGVDEVVAIVTGISGITFSCGGDGMLEILLGSCTASTIVGGEGGSGVMRMGTTSLSLLLSPSTWKMVGTALGVSC